jgi:hypothetical protein
VLIAQLYGVTPQAITQHIHAVYEEHELNQAVTCKDYLQVQTEGKRQVSHYSLQDILAAGYLVRSTTTTFKKLNRWHSTPNHKQR